MAPKLTSSLPHHSGNKNRRSVHQTLDIRPHVVLSTDGANMDVDESMVIQRYDIQATKMRFQGGTVVMYSQIPTCAGCDDDAQVAGLALLPGVVDSCVVESPPSCVGKASSALAGASESRRRYSAKTSIEL